MYEVSFDNCTFRKETKFISDKSPVFGSYCSFNGVILSKDEEIVFFRTNLEKALFHDTNLEKIIFRDVYWGKATTRLQRLLRGNSYLLWDEIRPLEGMRDWHDDDKTAENYRQLVLNYEAKRDYETAEYFHIGEMEMRRKKLEAGASRYLSRYFRRFLRSRFNDYWYKFRLRYLIYPFDLIYETRKKLNGYVLYLISSRYGTSYSQAILILILLILLFPVFFLYAGFKSGKESTVETPRIIEYNFLADSTYQTVGFGQWISDYSEALSYTLSIITFQRECFYEPLGWESRMLLYAAVLILTTQAAFVLLAIRRQFKR